jgi:hypothetical protein
MSRIFTDYYKAEKLTEAKGRYDVTRSTASYEQFESLFINKRKFNVGGLSFNYVDRPRAWKGEQARKPEKAITKGIINVSSIFVPSLKEHLIGYGDVQNTRDAIIVLFNDNYTMIELFIARGYVNDLQALYTFVKEGDCSAEFDLLRDTAKTVFQGKQSTTNAREKVMSRKTLSPCFFPFLYINT